MRLMFVDMIMDGCVRSNDVMRFFGEHGLGISYEVG